MTERKTKRKAGPAGAESTRIALMMAGLRLFGQKGFEATSTREIAAEAKANIGSIAYHFGGKEGLRTACAQHIVDTIRGVASAAVGLDDTTLLSQHEAETRILEGVRRMVQFMIAGPEAGDFVQFILRELSSPGGALDTIYQGVFEPVHKRLCQLWAQATGEDAESDQTRLAVFSMIGQVVYFRIGREAVLRRMGWSAYGSEESTRLTAVFTENIRAALNTRRQGRP